MLKLIFGTIGFFTFIANFVVLIAILSTRLYRKCPGNVLLAGMATADAIVGLVNIPSIIVPDIVSLSFTDCRLMLCFVLFIGNTSNFMTVGLTLDKLLFILSPLKYHHIMNCRSAMVVVFVLWVLGVISGFVPYFIMDDELQQNYNLSNPHLDLEPSCTRRSVIPMEYLVSSFLILYGIVLIILLLTNVYTFSVIRRHHKRKRANSIAYKSKRANSIAYQKKRFGRGSIASIIAFGEAAPEPPKTNPNQFLISITSIFIVCTLPLVVTYVIEYSASGVHVPRYAMSVMEMMYNINSLINPFIYAFSNNKLKTLIQNIICCKALRSLCRKKSLPQRRTSHLSKDSSPPTTFLTQPSPKRNVTPVSSLESSSGGQLIHISGYGSSRGPDLGQNVGQTSHDMEKSPPTFLSCHSHSHNSRRQSFLQKLPRRLSNVSFRISRLQQHPSTSSNTSPVTRGTSRRQSKESMTQQLSDTVTRGTSRGTSRRQSKESMTQQLSGFSSWV